MPHPDSNRSQSKYTEYVDWSLNGRKLENDFHKTLKGAGSSGKADRQIAEDGTAQTAETGRTSRAQRRAGHSVRRGWPADRADFSRLLAGPADSRQLFESHTRHNRPATQAGKSCVCHSSQAGSKRALFGSVHHWSVCCGCTSRLSNQHPDDLSGDIALRLHQPGTTIA
jgi:hypothetical protein